MLPSAATDIQLASAVGSGSQHSLTGFTALELFLTLGDSRGVAQYCKGNVILITVAFGNAIILVIHNLVIRGAQNQIIIGFQIGISMALCSLPNCQDVRTPLKIGIFLAGSGRDSVSICLYDMSINRIIQRIMAEMRRI